jgi:hypothetical protein
MLSVLCSCQFNSKPQQPTVYYVVFYFVQVSAFYASENPPRTLVRFCFCKDDSKLERACRALREYFSGSENQVLA